MISVQPPDLSRRPCVLKWVQCIRRRPELTVVEFRRLWVEYGEEVVALGAEVGAFRVEVSASLAVEANLAWRLQRGSAAPFDGIAELHFSGSAPEFFEVLKQPGPKGHVDRLLLLQEGFVDVPHSCFFLASQDVEAEFSLPPD
jgi:hypothetical protein